MSRICVGIVSAVIALTLAGVPASSATLTTYPSEPAFFADIDPAVVMLYNGFDAIPPGSTVSTQVPGVRFSSPNAGLPGFMPIQTLDVPQAITDPNILGGGSVADQSSRQVMVLEFDSPATAIAFVVLGPDSVLRQITIEFEFASEPPQTLMIPDVDGVPDPREFFAVVSDVPFLRMSITSNHSSGGLFQSFLGIENMDYGGFDIEPPICSGAISTQAGILGVDGRGTDDRPTDSGIGSVAPGVTNLNLDLTVDPFTPGDPVATFRIQPGDPLADAVGTVLVTDVAGNSCELCLNFRNLSPGPTLEEVLCCADGLAFFVNNDEPTPPGPSLCSSTPHGPQQPLLPFGYEPSKFGDPFPCSVLTIDSPISGVTEMIMIKDGVYDPDLRMLASSSPDGGLTFPSFSDVTLEVIPKLDVFPDPTQLRGQTSWSVVKVACAVLAERCDGVDNDGDGTIDEGLPVGDSSIDVDQDGWPLCNADLTLSDCEDQNAAINPGGTEICNGLDDNCDGILDENNPGGGEACAVPDLLGACAEGETLCHDAEIGCIQTVFPTAEVCDGVDNDCDGEIDEIVRPAGICDLAQSNFNVTSESKAFKFRISSLADTCDPGNPTALDPAQIGTAWISRVGAHALPDPATLQCPDPFSGYLGETGIVENVAERKNTGNGIDLRFTAESDGDCRTLDGSRQEVFALLADVVDGSTVPICFSSTINGVVFECCDDVNVTNQGNR